MQIWSNRTPLVFVPLSQTKSYLYPLPDYHRTPYRRPCRLSSHTIASPM